MNEARIAEPLGGRSCKSHQFGYYKGIMWMWSNVQTTEWQDENPSPNLIYQTWIFPRVCVTVLGSWPRRSSAERCVGGCGAEVAGRLTTSAESETRAELATMGI